MNCRLILIGFFIFCVNFLVAQETEVMTKNYLFNDGVYLEFQDFANNQPAYTWKEMRVNIIPNPLTFTAKSDRIFYVIEEDKIVENIWGFCLAGIPYIKLPDTTSLLQQYAGMRVRGKICYFSYEEIQPKTAAISAYNPYNGEPFRTAEISIKEKSKKEMMLRMEDGMVEHFKLENFRHWIKDDLQLTASLADLDANEVEEKLFKCLLIYNDRNEVMVPITNSKTE